MSEDSTPKLRYLDIGPATCRDLWHKQPEKKIKTSTLLSESWAMPTTEQDNTELQDVMEASEFNEYLSLLGRKLIKNLLESSIPLDLKAINQMVLEKEDGGHSQQQEKPKKGDDDEDIKEFVLLMGKQ